MSTADSGRTAVSPRPSWWPVQGPSGTADRCLVCNATNWRYLFEKQCIPVMRCAQCGLMRLDPRPTREHRAALYGNQVDPSTTYLAVPDSRTEQRAAADYTRILAHVTAPGASILVVAPLGHPIAGELNANGFAVTSYTASQLTDMLPIFTSTHYEAAVVIFQLERCPVPTDLLRRVHAALRMDGYLLIVTPTTDSWSARVLGHRWTEWRPENLHYFDSRTIQTALLRAGFNRILIRRDRRSYSFDHLYGRAGTYPGTALTRLVRFAAGLLPRGLRQRASLRMSSSGMIVSARKTAPRERATVSIVMPVYNERESFLTTLQAVVDKPLGMLDKELIVVESNSTDGTRELALRARQEYPIKLVLQDQPRGKGNAVRAGLAHATGEYVLIQDADGEYDVSDYDALLEPLIKGERAFVLGSRHVGDWKIREFNDQPVVASVFNFGHLIFLTLFNALYGQELRDPFTMYKVFRRDCLHGLKLECDRFDFDFEIVIKLLRKGYAPVEIPVNYRARSFSQGKKVSVLHDPLTWVRALIRYRWARIYTDNVRILTS